MIGVIDYGVGNIRAFANIYKKLNVQFKVVQRKEDLDDVDKLILPGVGAFDHAMEKLNDSGMREMLDDLVLKDKLPVLGICVGMQMLANSSQEGKSRGLGWIDGSVKRFDESFLNFTTHLPHMGWNDIVPIASSAILVGLERNARFYFLHSYYFECNDMSNAIAVSNYGINFSCAVNNENIYGVQFHPEKSHQYGIQLLENFAKL